MAAAFRRNLIHRTAENFRPPVFKPNTTARNTLENRLRRFLDLQSGSGWRDMRTELAGLEGRLVDIGCGAQVYRALVPAGVSYLGIDTVDAKERFGYAIPNTHYFEGEEWGVPDGAFDAALCTEVLEHIPDPAVFLARVHRCLRPGGRLVMTVPFAARWHFVPHDYWRFTPSSLRMLLEGAGFDEVRVTARGNPLTVACYKAMALPLMLLFGSDSNRPSAAIQLGGVLLLPFVGALACLANATMGGDWGDDCLGYTVTARRP